jgi:hypothetical protein
MAFACPLSESGVNGQEWISAMHEIKNITTTPEVLKLIADIDEFKDLSGENQVSFGKLRAGSR